MQKKGIYAVLMFLAACQFSFAQKEKEDSGQIDSKYFAYGLTTNTHSGLLGGFVFRSSTPVSTTKRNMPVHRYIALELVNIKNPKENAVTTLLGSKFVLGKVNYLFALRPEFGREWYFFRKGGDSSIGLSGILAAGPTIGIQKPYYIKYGTSMNEQATLVVYDPDVNTDYNAIVGSGNIWQGFLNNAKMIPGFHLKAATSIDMNAFGDNITGLELGATLEVYSKAPEIISAKLTDNPKAYATAYLTLYFGSKKIIKK